MNLIYTQVPAKIREFIGNIPTWGVPQKITQTELSSLGYKSSNDRTIVSVLKALDIISGDGRPTGNWQGLRDRENARPLLGHLIRQAYSELYETYPSAHSITDTQLKNFLSSRTKAGERAVQMAIATFKALCSLASFDEAPILPADFTELAVASSLSTRETAAKKAIVHSSPTMAMNINITVDGSAKPETIQALLDGLGRLYRGESANEN